MRPMKRKFVGIKSKMLSLKMFTFCKNANCPSSQELLAFQKNETAEIEAREIIDHLDSCEFCTAEVEFYAHFPQNEEAVLSSDIPLPLFELAEALLSSKNKKFSLLNKMLNENEGLSLNKA